MTMKSTRSLLDLNFSLVAKAATMAPTSTVNVTPTKYMEPVRIVKFNPTLAAVIVAMIISFFVVGFATTYLKKCIRAAEADDDDDLFRNRLHGQSASQILKPQRGLDPEIVEALPLIQYKDLPADEKMRKYYDCPVCLAAFDANDRLRLLPECSHAFHSDCIDVWFLSHSTCPLCRAYLVHPHDKASREESGRYAEDDEPVETRAREDLDIVEVVISGGLERDRGGSTAILRSSQDRNSGAPMVNASAAEQEEERLIARPFLWSNAGGSFRPAVRVVTAPEKLFSLASIRRSSSAGTGLQQFLHPSYVVDSEGTQHNSKFFQMQAMNLGEFAQQDQTNGSPSRPVSLAHHRITVDLEGGPIESGDISSKIPEDCSTRWSFPNLRQIALA